MEVPGRFKEQQRVGIVLLEWNGQDGKRQGMKLEGGGAGNRACRALKDFRS